ncbi:hypothetical protein TcG_05934 [Trypanosoma cruzi]|uniref:Uncharacterized protein n=2 Tax=Trypanosoma cruzi TaxID=5693 RepID=V5ASD7_TRYCR|nr:hypothetical protein TCDM_08375 [Trypanosoma cruzi Dm28c]KAF8283093.1 hypothetical protein TcBrA4_0078830 [Trypanosoma cruzi]PBJ72205.1 hypothetical protein BCY84_15783 [Trypanosoma cruzi cruzi]PBJ78716.1 hypothetical protein BCY84_04038 [Trypanosoma cruzi cruzi]PBJ78718.1 hypothetical protein BCY84_04041 [Trypanosoma cruzi cruzi]
MFLTRITHIARPFTFLSFTVNEFVGRNKVEPCATLSVSRSSTSKPWELSIHQRKKLIYLDPLPKEALYGSVVAKQFLTKDALPYVNSVLIASVNGVPADSARNVRRELGRCDTAVFHLILRCKKYHPAEKEQQEGTAEALEATETEPPQHGSNVRVAVPPAAVKRVGRPRKNYAEAKIPMGNQNLNAQQTKTVPSPKRSPEQTKPPTPPESIKKMPKSVHANADATAPHNAASTGVRAEKTSMGAVSKAKGLVKGISIHM